MRKSNNLYIIKISSGYTIYILKNTIKRIIIRNLRLIIYWNLVIAVWTLEIIITVYISRWLMNITNMIISKIFILKILEFIIHKTIWLTLLLLLL